MVHRPEFLGQEYAARFQDQSVVDRYHLRPTYPPETFSILDKLIVDEPRTVLDVGCGPGNLARYLLDFAERIDAVDISQPMLELASTLPGGASPKLRWLYGSAENAALQPPYALITAGASLHWMDWNVVLPRFARFLTPRGVLAIVDVYEHANPWGAGYVEIVRQFSNNPTYQPIDLIAELETRCLFQQLGDFSTSPVPQHQTIDDYIGAQHARSALSLDTMTSSQAVQFTTEMRALLQPFAQDEIVTMQVVGHVVWGKPLILPQM